jgi:hypothetical protein
LLFTPPSCQIFVQKILNKFLGVLDYSLDIFVMLLCAKS